MEDTFLISTPFKSVKVHPLVPLTILEFYNRRQENQEVIVGTIMGSIINGTLEITNCYSVNYDLEGNEITDEQKQFNEGLAKLYSTANKSEQIIGWFSTTLAPVKAEKKWYQLNAYYRSLCQVFKPIFLTVNVSFEGESIDIDAYSVTSVVLNTEVLAIKFTKLPLSTSASAVENQIVTSLGSIQNSEIPNSNAESYNDLQSLKAEMESLMSTLEETEKYIQQVMNKEITPTPEKTRKVFNAIASVPMVPKEEFVAMFNKKLQDFSLVSYLSSLAYALVENVEVVNTTAIQRS
ncbi:hypothetical protein WA577_000168 [Blastocystis sp. JDR]